MGHVRPRKKKKSKNRTSHRALWTAPHQLFHHQQEKISFLTILVSPGIYIFFRLNYFMLIAICNTRSKIFFKRNVIYVQKRRNRDHFRFLVSQIFSSATFTIFHYKWPGLFINLGVVWIQELNFRPCHVKNNFNIQKYDSNYKTNCRTMKLNCETNLMRYTNS